MIDFQAVIFDMDGVIVDSEPHHERAFYDVLHELGYDGPGSLKFADYVGRYDLELWVDFVDRHKPPPSVPIQTPLVAEGKTESTARPRQRSGGASVWILFGRKLTRPLPPVPTQRFPSRSSSSDKIQSA